MQQIQNKLPRNPKQLCAPQACLSLCCHQILIVLVSKIQWNPFRCRAMIAYLCLLLPGVVTYQGKSRASSGCIFCLDMGTSSPTSCRLSPDAPCAFSRPKVRAGEQLTLSQDGCNECFHWERRAFIWLAEAGYDTSFLGLCKSISGSMRTDSLLAPG